MILFLVSLYELESSCFKSNFDGLTVFAGSDNSNRASLVFELSANVTYQSHHA